jgi:lipopolysaccharide export system permease protein
MRTLRRYLATEIVAATIFVSAALVMLFAFFDLVEQLKDLGRGAYGLRQILLYVAVLIPVACTKSSPIAALIGALFALAQLVAGSEYTVMRTSGVSTARFAGYARRDRSGVAVIAFSFGELLAPAADQFATALRSQAIYRTGAQEFRSACG